MWYLSPFPQVYTTAASNSIQVGGREEGRTGNHIHVTDDRISGKKEHHTAPSQFSLSDSSSLLQ